MKIILFDLDDTLAPSKSRIHPSMVDLLTAVLQRVDVCIISGGRFEQFENQVLTPLAPHADLTRLHIMPTCGTQYYRWVADGLMTVTAGFSCMQRTSPKTRRAGPSR